MHNLPLSFRATLHQTTLIIAGYGHAHIQILNYTLLTFDKFILIYYNLTQIIFGKRRIFREKNLKKSTVNFEQKV